MTPTSTEALAALMRLADSYANACFEQGLHQRTEDPEPEQKREALVAELHHLSAERDKFASESAQNFVRAREWAERAGRMEAERNELRADAERYRFLAERCRSTSAPRCSVGWSIVIEGPAPKTHDSEDDFDAAIDAAMKGTQ